MEKDVEAKIFEKIIDLKKIKNLYFILYQISNYDISKIKGENKSLTNLSITWKNYKENCLLINL